MKQAILITAYKNLPQLNDLLDSFDDNFVFYIHLDRKSNVSQTEINQLAGRSGVKYLSQKYKISWGGVNHLHAILELLEEANKEQNISHFHLITGQDFPIKSNADIVSFLRANPDKIFMEYNLLPYHKWFEGGFERLNLYNLNDWFYGRDGIGRSIVMGFKAIQKRLGIKRGYPTSFPKQIYGGSTYWTLNKASVDYVFDYLSRYPEYLKRFKWTFCAEEVFFQTIIMNSPLAKNVINDPLRFIVWEERNGSYPANLDDSDFDEMKLTSALFARKVQSPYSDQLLEKLKEYRKS